MAIILNVWLLHYSHIWHTIISYRRLLSWQAWLPSSAVLLLDWGITSVFLARPSHYRFLTFWVSLNHCYFILKRPYSLWTVYQNYQTAKNYVIRYIHAQFLTVISSCLSLGTGYGNQKFTYHRRLFTGKINPKCLLSQSPKILVFISMHS